jgi:YidC/Oxa1 family membrane protein insertase
MDKKTLVAIVLSVGIIFSWPFILKTFFPQAVKKTNIQQQQYSDVERNKTAESISFAKQTAIVPQSASVAHKNSSFSQTIVSSDKKEEISSLKNNEIELVFSNKGAVLKNVNLLKYLGKKDKQAEQLINEQEKFSDIFNISEPINLKDIFFTAKKINDNVLEFKARINDSLILKKIYTLQDKYIFKVDFVFENISTQELSFFEGCKLELSSGIGTFNKKDARFNGVGVVFNNEKKTIKVFKKNKPETFYQEVYWVGQFNKYFCLLVKPSSVVTNVYVEPKQDKKQPALNFRTKGFYIEPNSEYKDSYIVYVGPKDISILKQQKYLFEKIINFGFFNIIGQFLLWMLNFFFGIVKNYGIAIILLTITIKLILYPLTQKSFKSMKEMQKIQPLLKQLKENYKNDPQRMQKETMLLYKKHKVNPVGGCFPMLLQMPIFFALFSVLQNSIELRQSPFMFWIQDLSQKDPTYILPIVMGVSMVLQQKMSPTTVDPKQAKIMMIMPVFFTFIFINFPSGLVLYWLTNNLLTIGHQMLMNKKAN